MTRESVRKVGHSQQIINIKEIKLNKISHTTKYKVFQNWQQMNGISIWEEIYSDQ